MSAFNAAFIIGIVMLAGCAVNPSTGRSQLIAYPAAQIAHADIGFAISAAAQGVTYSSPCAILNRRKLMPNPAVTPCPSEEEIAKFSLQVERLGKELAAEVPGIAPEELADIGVFHIQVERNSGVGTFSSAGGRIALSSDLAVLDPTDDVVAFLIAREMGHVIARHGEEDSGAQMAFSTLTAIIPGGGLIVKFAASMLGSQALKSTWAQAQRREADELALKLLGRCSRSPKSIAFNLRVGLRHDRLPAGEWSASFAQSVAYVDSIDLARGQLAADQQREREFLERGNTEKVALSAGKAPIPLLTQANDAVDP